MADRGEDGPLFSDRVEIRSDELAPPKGHYSQAIAVSAHDTWVFISGMTALDRDGSVTAIGDVVGQTHQVCLNLRAAVRAAGGDLDHIVRVDVYVRNIEDFEAIHEVRREYFTQTPPASTLVEVSKFVNKDYLIEMSAIAMIPKAIQ